jgi:hypothetical protein
MFWVELLLDKLVANKLIVDELAVDKTEVVLAFFFSFFNFKMLN